jgi:hypothetical protein
MRTQPKSIIALASGAILISCFIGQSAQAQSIVLGTPGSSLLAYNNGSATGSDELTVTWDVTLTGSIYDYSYTVFNPAGVVTSFSVGFNSDAAGALLAGSETASGGANNNGIGVIWNPLLNSTHGAGVGPGQTSETLSFQSDDPPVYGNANANGSAPGPWASAPLGQQVPVPNPVPEPATAGLLALGLMLFPFRSSIRKRT